MLRFRVGLCSRDLIRVLKQQIRPGTRNTVYLVRFYLFFKWLDLRHTNAMSRILLTSPLELQHKYITIKTINVIALIYDDTSFRKFSYI